MAAYGALVSVMNVMEQIQNHPRHSISVVKKQIEALSEKISFLQDFIEGYPHGVSEEAEDLENQIASAAYAAEDVIESHVVDRIHVGSISLLDLQEVIEEMDSIKEKVIKFKEERIFKDLKPTYSITFTSSRHLTTDKNTMVGFDDKLIQLMDGLTGQQSSRQIISIVGMGGIGKTTLARNVYENLVIVQHFDIRAWVTVSQQCNVREILLQLLSFQREQESKKSLVASTSEIDGETEDLLGEKLYKTLSGRRYLIVLDDLWSIDAWDKIKFFFPDNGKRSRIVVTTRLSNVAINFGSSWLAMKLLDEDQSWNLFCDKAFAQEGCPPEFEEIGKKIARKCKGLPLSIVVIGGVLGKSNRIREYWENVAKDINSILNSREDEHCLNILSLSYSLLPVHLKPCFLYMGIFPEDHEVRVSRLIKLWVAEGFLKQNKAQSLEEVAEDYISDLVDRNLILVRRLGSNGRIKTCNIHDLLRDVCLRLAEKEKFLCVMRVLDTPRGIGRERRIIFHESIPKKDHDLQVFYALRSASLTRSLICEGGQLPYKFRLLRVLNVVDDDSLETIFGQVNLRYLAYEHLLFSYSKLPSSISLLWNIQTLIIRGGIKHIVAPCEIWVMPQLRHVEIDKLCLPDAPNGQVQFILRNLQTLLEIMNFRWSVEVCRKMPNVKKLHIRYDDSSEKCGVTSSYYSLYNLSRLCKLESLNCSFAAGLTNRCDLLQNLTFPTSLRKLALTNCQLHWEDLTMIGSLPHLEVLKLELGSVIGPEWNPVEGEFLRLKMLKIYCRDLICWNADSFHFPVLEKLVLGDMSDLEEIPLGIGEIATLGVICLYWCNVSTVISAMKIVEEQESLGNEGLHVRVEFWSEVELESFRAKMELESFTSNNFQVRAAFKD